MSLALSGVYEAKAQPAERCENKPMSERPWVSASLMRLRGAVGLSNGETKARQSRAMGELKTLATEAVKMFAALRRISGERLSTLWAHQTWAARSHWRSRETGWDNGFAQRANLKVWIPKDTSFGAGLGRRQARSATIPVG